MAPLVLFAKDFSFIESETEFVQISASNITFSRNCIKSIGGYSNLYGIKINYDNLTNIVIQGNYIDVGYSGYNQSTYAIYSTKSGLSLSINNNYLSTISNSVSYKRTIYLTGSSGTYSFSHNVFDGDLYSKNGAYLNNILVDGSVSGSNNFYYYNLCNSTQFANELGNQQNVGMSVVFVDHTPAVDTGLILAPGSPAIGAGFEGVDCGIFGGNNPYVLSGMPPIPSIFELTHTGIGSVATPIQVNFKAKSNR